MPSLSKATLQEIDASSPPKILGEAIPLQFNPQSLKLALANKVEGGDSVARQKRQYLGKTSTTLSFDLMFDTADQGTPDKPVSVRTQTAMVERFVLPKGKGNDKQKPPKCRFSWDALVIDCSLMQMVEVAYEIRNTASFIVGSEESPPGEGYPYDSTLLKLAQNPNMTGRDLCVHFANDTIERYGVASNSTQSVLDTSKVAAIVPELENLGAKLQAVKDTQGTKTSPMDDALTSLLLGFGTVFFYAAIRGEVWFSAEVMGIALTALYLRNAVGARRPLLAGVFWSMAVLTRTPLFFTGLFFFLELAAPERGARGAQLRAFFKAPGPKLKALGRFVAGAAPLGVLAAGYNLVRFGSLTEFGHRFLFNNRVNHDIDTFGLFNLHYLTRNLDAAFLKLPLIGKNPVMLGYDAWGMSLFITLPLLALCFVPATEQKRVLQLMGAFVGLLIASAIFAPLSPPPGEPPIGWRPIALWLVFALVLAFIAFTAWQWATAKDAPRLVVPVLLTLLACMLPGLAYQNTGYAQFGFRFSLDYTPYLLLLIPLAGWSWKKPLPMALALLSIVANFWGAVGFRGYTELVRGW